MEKESEPNKEGPEKSEPKIDPQLKKRKDEAVFRLLSDINHNIAATLEGNNANNSNSKRFNRRSSMDEESDDSSDGNSSSSGSSYDDDENDEDDNSENGDFKEFGEQEYEDAILTTAIASAIERGIDKEFFEEISKSARDSAAQIAKICQDHSEPFLESVAKVYQTVGPEAAILKEDMKVASALLQDEAGYIMLEKAKTLEEYRSMDVRSRTMLGILQACRRVAVLLEKAKRNAALSRPRYALDAVEEARQCLTAPISRLLLVDSTGANNKGISSSYKQMLTNEIMISRQKYKDNESYTESEGGRSNPNSGSNIPDGGNSAMPTTSIASATGINIHDVQLTLEETPFGARAMEILPKIENEVMMNARRGFNKFILAMRSEGDNGKVGSAAMRKCALSMSIGGPAGLGLGGSGRGYEWQALNADNMISRVHHQTGRVAKAARAAYYYSRDCPREVYRIKLIREGMPRRAVAFAAAFGWYRCWDDNANLGVDVADDATHSSSKKSTNAPNPTSRFAIGSAARTASTQTAVSGQKGGKYPMWANLMTPTILFDDAPNKKEQEEKLHDIPESVHPILHAQVAYALSGRIDEFHTLYEQNRFGEMKIEGREAKSCLSSLTGDDVYHGTDRIFFAKTLPHLCATIIGFCAVEAALFNTNEELLEVTSSANSSSNNTLAASKADKSVEKSQLTTSVSRESSIRYERMLLTELGSILRERAVNATLPELVRASTLIVTLRSTLKIVHPSSPVRKSDRELLSIDVDIIMNVLKKTQEEQMKYTTKIVNDERYEPMKKGNLSNSNKKGAKKTRKNYPLYGPAATMHESFTNKTNDANKDDQQNSTDGSKSEAKDSKEDDMPALPLEEQTNLPFGLQDLVQAPSIDKTIDALDQLAAVSFRKSHHNKAMAALDAEICYTFSHSVPVIIRSIHGRAISFAAFCHSQQELGQIFPQKHGGGIASFVLDTLEACITIVAVSMKGGFKHFDELTVPQAVQIKANLSALQHALPRLFGTLIRGLCHVGLIHAQHLEEAFAYADKTLAAADRACDKEVGSMFSMIFDMCVAKIDVLMNFSLENFAWVAKTLRDYPNTYAESLVEFMRNTFASLGPLDEASRKGLHFSCCSHVAERVVKLLCDKTDGDSHYMDSLPPIYKIDVFALKNLTLDIQCFETFAKTTGVAELTESFAELRNLVYAVLDKDLPLLLQPNNSVERQRRYPFLKLDKLGMILEKYKEVGLGMKMMKSSKNLGGDFLMMERKDIQNCLRLIRMQL